MIIIAILIKLDSKGPIFFKQIRVTKNGREFKIFKYRTMRVGSDKFSQITVGKDSRITKVGDFAAQGVCMAGNAFASVLLVKGQEDFEEAELSALKASLEHLGYASGA